VGLFTLITIMAWLCGDPRFWYSTTWVDVLIRPQMSCDRLWLHMCPLAVICTVRWTDDFTHEFEQLRAHHTHMPVQSAVPWIILMFYQVCAYGCKAVCWVAILYARMIKNRITVTLNIPNFVIQFVYLALLVVCCYILIAGSWPIHIFWQGVTCGTTFWQ
jgi:hypothetical protein